MQCLYFTHISSVENRLYDSVKRFRTTSLQNKSRLLVVLLMNQNPEFATRLVFIKPSMQNGYNGTYIYNILYNQSVLQLMIFWPDELSTNQPPLHPQKLTWNLEMMVSNRNLLFQGSIFRFHVCFGGCTKQKKLPITCCQPTPPNPPQVGPPGHCDTNSASNAALSDHLDRRCWCRQLQWGDPTEVSYPPELGMTSCHLSYVFWFC